MLCFRTVKKRLKRRSVISCYHGSKISRFQKSFSDGRKVRAKNALAIRLSKHDLLYFHSSGQQLCKFLATNESSYTRKEFNLHSSAFG